MTPIRIKRTLAIAVAAPLLLGAPAVAEESAKPAVGTWAFNLLHDPQTVTCVPVTQTLLKSFRSCQHEEDGGFVSGYPVDVCTVSETVRYMVFTTRARCDENRETQAANE